MNHTTHYTQEMLQARRSDLSRELGASRRRIKTHWDNLFEEPKAQTGSERLLSNVERGIAVYDGFMTAYKLFKWVRTASHLFAKKKK